MRAHGRCRRPCACALRDERNERRLRSLVLGNRSEVWRRHDDDDVRLVLSVTIHPAACGSFLCALRRCGHEKPATRGPHDAREPRMPRGRAHADEDDDVSLGIGVVDHDAHGLTAGAAVRSKQRSSRGSHRRRRDPFHGPRAPHHADELHSRRDRRTRPPHAVALWKPDGTFVTKVRDGCFEDSLPAGNPTQCTPPCFASRPSTSPQISCW